MILKKKPGRKIVYKTIEEFLDYHIKKNNLEKYLFYKIEDDYVWLILRVGDEEESYRIKRNKNHNILKGRLRKKIRDIHNGLIEIGVLKVG